MSDIVVGIDPGTATVGYSFVRGTKQKPEIIDFGVLTTPANAKEHLASRLAEISQDFELLVKKYQPTKAVIEDIFFTNNQKTVIAVAQGRGAILAVMGKHNLPVQSPTPLQVKQTICGYGKANKKAVQTMVMKLYKLDKIPTPDDAADSLAIAWWGL